MAFKKRGKTGKKAIDIAVEHLTAKIKHLGFLPWTRPHLMVKPRNYVTGTEYKGINVWLLYGGSGEFITINQLDKLNEKYSENDDKYRINKGTKASIVVYYNRTEKEIPESVALERVRENKTYGLVQTQDGRWLEVKSVMRYTNVYDISDIVNGHGQQLPTKVRSKNKEEDIPTNEDAEKLIQNYAKRYGVELVEKRGIPNASLDGKRVEMPPKADFDNDEVYYRTFFHEIVHTTGREDLLNRDSVKTYKSHKGRSREELVAEAGASKLAMVSGYTDDTFAKLNSDIYIAGWCEWMVNHPNELVKGLNEVEKAVELILNASGLGLVQEVEDNKVKAVAKPLAQPKEAMAFEEYIHKFVKATDKTNNGRTSKVWGRIVEHGYDKFLQDIGFTVFGIVEGNPVLKLVLGKEKDKGLVVGMTFGFMVKLDKDKVTEYKLLYSLERGNSILDVQEIAKNLKVRQLYELTQLMDLRSKLSTYQPKKAN